MSIKESIMSVTLSKEYIRWFSDSPDAGADECICSLCAGVITDIPIRLLDMREDGNLEARFHILCFETVISQRLPRIAQMMLDDESVLDDDDQ